jgi:hypothetical protein
VCCFEHFETSCLQKLQVFKSPHLPTFPLQSSPSFVIRLYSFCKPITMSYQVPADLAQKYGISLKTVYNYLSKYPQYIRSEKRF